VPSLAGLLMASCLPHLHRCAPRCLAYQQTDDLCGGRTRWRGGLSNCRKGACLRISPHDNRNQTVLFFGLHGVDLRTSVSRLSRRNDSVGATSEKVGAPNERRRDDVGASWWWRMTCGASQAAASANATYGSEKQHFLRNIASPLLTTLGSGASTFRAGRISANDRAIFYADAYACSFLLAQASWEKRTGGRATTPPPSPPHYLSR